MAAKLEDVLVENFEEICRFCLNKGQLINFFTLSYEGISFKTIMNRLLFIELDLEEDMPQNVCQTCINEIVTFHKFRMKCNESEMVLRTVLKKRHLKIPAESHFVDAGLKTEAEIDLLPILSDENKFSSVLDEERRLCPLCEKEFSCLSYLKRHMNNVHGDKNFPCQTCGKLFSSQSSLYDHQRIHKEEKRHSCDVCHKKFRGEWMLKRHMRTHTGEKPFGCHICGQKFGETSHLKRHLKTHLKEKRAHVRDKLYICHICCKHFARNTHLKKHLNVHLGEKMHECEYCQRKFHHLANLRVHILNKHEDNRVKNEIDIEENKLEIKMEFEK